MVHLSVGEQEAVWVKTVDYIEAAVRQSSPEARQEVELAQIRAEMRAHVRRDPHLREMRERSKLLLREASTAAERQEVANSLNSIVADGNCIFGTAAHRLSGRDHCRIGCSKATLE